MNQKRKNLKYNLYKLYFSVLNFEGLAGFFLIPSPSRKACPHEGRGRESFSKTCPCEGGDQPQFSNRISIALRKIIYNNLYGKYFCILLIFFSFSAFSDHDKHCDILMSWNVPVCGPTAEERTYKANILSHELAKSLTRKKMIPEKVIKAGKAVFSIGTQKTFREWSWHFKGGSGFFMFNNRTFFTAYHVLESLLEDISQWDEVVFKDQNENQQNFKIKGVKFASELHDIVAFEVEGYEGPVLELSMEPPQEQSYVIGYPKSQKQKIQTVGYPFEATDTYYGAFIELFDCYYGYYFRGASGGPLVNREGKVEGISSAVMGTPLPSDCGFFLAKKLNVLTERSGTDGILSSLEEVTIFMIREKIRTIALAEEGNIDARITLLNQGEGDMIESASSPNDLMQHMLMTAIIGNRQRETIDNILTEKLDNPMLSAIMRSLDKKNGLYDLLFSLVEESILSSEPQEILPVTWYEIGIAFYYIDSNLGEACYFWNNARQTGHPFVFSDFVIIPNMDIVRCEFFMKEATNILSEKSSKNR